MIKTLPSPRLTPVQLAEGKKGLAMSKMLLSLPKLAQPTAERAHRGASQNRGSISDHCKEKWTRLVPDTFS